jgi:hypothetical protein
MVMKKMEQLELEAYRSEIDADMRSLVEKYRRVFGWDIPEIDQQAEDKLIVESMRKTLDDIQTQ